VFSCAARNPHAAPQHKTGEGRGLETRIRLMVGTKTPEAARWNVLDAQPRAPATCLRSSRVSRRVRRSRAVRGMLFSARLEPAAIFILCARCVFDTALVEPAAILILRARCVLDTALARRSRRRSRSAKRVCHATDKRPRAASEVIHARSPRDKTTRAGVGAAPEEL
jgi:hypothetical protein